MAVGISSLTPPACLPRGTSLWFPAAGRGGRRNRPRVSENHKGPGCRDAGVCGRLLPRWEHDSSPPLCWPISLFALSFSFFFFCGGPTPPSTLFHREAPGMPPPPLLPLHPDSTVQPKTCWPSPWLKRLGWRALPTPWWLTRPWLPCKPWCVCQLPSSWAHSSQSCVCLSAWRSAAGTPTQPCL